MRQFKKNLWRLLAICVTLELFLFPSTDNALLCLLACIATFEFCLVINTNVFKEHTFSFLAYFTLFAYRYFPILGTLIDGNPVSYGFINAFEVFIAETITFSVATLSFYCSIKWFHKNTALTKLYKKWGFFKRFSVLDYWLLGFIGIFSWFLGKFINSPELGKLLATIQTFQFAPICLFFPALTGYKCNKRNIWWYVLLLVMLTLTSGSRQTLLSPICTFVLLFLLDSSISGKNIWSGLSMNKKIVILCFVFILPTLIERTSLAMLASRNVVFDKNKTFIDVFNSTLDNFQDGKKIKELSKAMDYVNSKSSNKDVGEWDERYISNTVLNRFCNLKLTDQTLYRLNFVGLNNKVMFDNFVTGNTVLLLPTPILNLLGIDVDKTKYQYSTGDLLYALSSKKSIFASYVVTSHVADGLAIFGYFYFPIQYFIWLLMFVLIDSFIFKINGSVIYSIFGLVSIFTFFGLTRASGGCGHDLYYCLRQYWNGVVGFFFVLFLLKICKYFCRKS